MFFRTPNRIAQEYKTFYVSYNTTDYFTYGAITTALVIGQMEIFYILEGDHREAYKTIGDDLEKSIEYFQFNIDKISKFSDKIGEPTAAQRISKDLKEKGYL